VEAGKMVEDWDEDEGEGSSADVRDQVEIEGYDEGVRVCVMRPDEVGRMGEDWGEKARGQGKA
jgi:hypothetical protein